MIERNATGLTALPVGYSEPGWIPYVSSVALVILRGPCWMLLGGVLGGPRARKGLL